jgi:hypothetical protein
VLQTLWKLTRNISRTQQHKLRKLRPRESPQSTCACQPVSNLSVWKFQDKKFDVYRFNRKAFNAIYIPLCLSLIGAPVKISQFMQKSNYVYFIPRVSDRYLFYRGRLESKAFSLNGVYVKNVKQRQVVRCPFELKRRLNQSLHLFTLCIPFVDIN